MLFFPYRSDLPIFRLPVWTILICFLCCLVFYFQFSANQKLSAETLEFCERDLDRNAQLFIRNLFGDSSSQACMYLLRTLHTVSDKNEKKEELIAAAKPLDTLTLKQSRAYYRKGVNTLYNRYQYSVSDDLTSVLAYDPRSWDVLKMFTSIFTHGNFSHIVGNLFFFIAFSVALEGLLGYLLYPVAFITLAASTNIFYSLYASTTTDVLPTVGLSGVVMGVVALLVFFIPKVKIRWFLLIIVFVRRPELPAWLVAMFYIGSDAYNFYTNADVGNINLVVHIVGGATGYLFGVLFLRGKRDEILDALEYDGSYGTGDIKRERRARSRQLKEISNEKRRRKRNSER